VQQTIHDCLTEAMDIDELQHILRQIETGEIALVARDLREPSPFAQEIINARPYAFLDDAPFEERRTLAIRNRSWVDPAENADYSALDIVAIERVREEAWPWVRSADELHDALMLMGYMSWAEVHGLSDTRGNSAAQLELADDLSLFLAELVKQQRATEVRRQGVRLVIASEKQPLFAALGSDWLCKPAVALPPALLPTAEHVLSKEAALTELMRGRLEALGPVTATQLAASLGLPRSEIEFALRSLEVEGFAFQGFYTPLTGAPQNTSEKEWCERRLLHRIHRYTIDAHRDSIKPVSLQVYMQYLFALHEVQPLSDVITLPGLTTVEALRRILQQLDGITAPATAWESDILPARLQHYDPAWLDQLCVSVVRFAGAVCYSRVRRVVLASWQGRLKTPH
jgi:ATP-dependent helicase Lhr and Lhr-like helicase